MSLVLLGRGTVLPPEERSEFFSGAALPSSLGVVPYFGGVGIDGSPYWLDFFIDAFTTATQPASGAVAGGFSAVLQVKDGSSNLWAAAFAGGYLPATANASAVATFGPRVKRQPPITATLTQFLLYGSFTGPAGSTAIVGSFGSAGVADCSWGVRPVSPSPR